MNHRIVRTIKVAAISAIALFCVTIGIGFQHVIAVTNDTWIASGPGNWSIATNWSTGKAPNSTNIAIFSASSTANATIDQYIPVAGIKINSGYTGTITQATGEAVIIGTSGYTQVSGAFVGSTASDTISDSGTFSVTGGTFTNSAGGLYLTGSASTFYAATFQDTNKGGVYFQGHTATITGSSTLYLASFGNGYSGTGSYAYTIATGTVLTVQSSTFFDPGGAFVGLIGGGSVSAQGNILLSGVDGDPCTTAPTSTASIVMNGTGTQTISDNGASNPGGGNCSLFNIPGNLTVTKTSGSVNLSGWLAINANFTNTNGTNINPGTSTMYVMGTRSSTIVGSSTFYNLIFSTPDGGVTSTITVATGTTLSVQGNLDLAKAYISQVNVIGGGVINVQGNIEAEGSVENYNKSNITVVMNGTTTQTIGDQTDCLFFAPWQTGGCPYMSLPGITITKTSGSVVLNGDIVVYILGNGIFTNTNATAINPQSSTIVFGQGDPTTPAAANSLNNWQIGSSTPLYGSGYVITGSSTFYNMQLGGYYYSGPAVNVTIATGTTVTAQGYLEISAPGNAYTQLKGGGTLNVQGNILTEQNYWTLYPTSTVAIVLNGTTNQLIGDSSQNAGAYVFLPNVTINKSGGVAYAENNIDIAGPSTVTKGELQLATGTQPTYFEADQLLTINSGARLADYPQATSSELALFGNVVNNGTVFFSGDGTSCSLPLPEYISIRAADQTTVQSWSGSGNFIMRYETVGEQTTPSAGPNIQVVNGTDLGDNNSGGGQWIFNPPMARPGLVQSVSSTSALASSLALPAFGFYPRASDLILVAVSARGQTIATPTDSAGNTYSLVTSTAVGSSAELALYYAKNINTTSSFVVTAHGSGGGMLSAAAFEYTSMNPSSTLDSFSAYSDNSGSATSLSSHFATGRSYNELYFGVMSLAANTTASSDPGWTTEASVINNSSNQSLYVEDIATTTELTTAATWTAATSTSYGAILGIFTTPFLNGYVPSGYLDSATFDTRVTTGAQLNSFTWQGNTPSNSAVKFQFAVSNSSSGPWNYEGPDGTSATYFCGSAGASVPLVSSNCSGGGSGGYLFTGYRYFRYRVMLYSDSTYTYSPSVSSVSVNWSP